MKEHIMTFMKRITAAVIATVMAAGMCGTMASADGKKFDEWETSHQNYPGMPTNNGKTTTCQMVYSTIGYKVYISAIKFEVHGGTGKVYVNCTNSNPKMETVIFESAPNEAKLTPRFYGLVSTANFTFTSSVSENNGIRASGSISSLDAK